MNGIRGKTGGKKSLNEIVTVKVRSRMVIGHDRSRLSIMTDHRSIFFKNFLN